jgi:hypothetical protein
MYVSSKAVQGSDQSADKKQQQSETTTAPCSDTTRINEHMINFPNLAQSQIPQSMINARTTFKCDIYQRKSSEELKFIRDYYFIKFMEGLNKLNRADERRSYSKSTVAYIESNCAANSNNDICIATSYITNITNNIGQNIMTNTVHPVSQPVSTQFSTKNQLLTVPTLNLRSSGGATPPLLNLTSPHKELYPLVRKYNAAAQDALLKKQIFDYLENEYKAHMLNTSYGLPFIQNKTDIPLFCFISAEAVWWCIEHVSAIDNEAEAICLMQIMCDFDVIRHISNQQKVFVHGFYLYYITTNENRSHHLYTKGMVFICFHFYQRAFKKIKVKELNLASIWDGNGRH